MSPSDEHESGGRQSPFLARILRHLLQNADNILREEYDATAEVVIEWSRDADRNGTDRYGTRRTRFIPEEWVEIVEDVDQDETRFRRFDVSDARKVWIEEFGEDPRLISASDDGLEEWRNEHGRYDPLANHV